MKIEIILVLTAFVCCYGQSSTSAPSTDDLVKEHLLKRAADLDARIKVDIKNLTDNGREHLALGLEYEQDQVDRLAKELKETHPGPITLRLLEEEIVRVEQRVENELKFLENEANGVSKGADMLLADAITLYRYVSEEIEKLEATTGEERERTLNIARSLRRDQLRLQELAQMLMEAQDQRGLSRTETELRNVEVRINEALRALNFKPTSVSTTAAPQPPLTAGPGTTRA